MGAGSLSAMEREVGCGMWEGMAGYRGGRGWYRTFECVAAGCRGARAAMEEGPGKKGQGFGRGGRPRLG